MISENDQIVEKFLNNDLFIAKILLNYIFSKGGVQNLNKNRARNLLVVKLKNSTSNEIINSILETTKLGEFEVQYRLPSNKAKSIGVIGPIGTDTPLKELHREISEQNEYIIKVESLKVKIKCLLYLLQYMLMTLSYLNSYISDSKGLKEVCL